MAYASDENELTITTVKNDNERATANVLIRISPELLGMSDEDFTAGK
jgi:hypothetical protein